MKKHLLSFGLILLIAAVLAPIFRNFVREVIIIPFLYIFWIGRFVVEAIPQAGLWSCFLIIISLILAIGLVDKQKRKSTLYLAGNLDEGRVTGWVKLIQQAETDHYFKWRLAQRLQKVALNVIAHQQGQSLKQTRQQLRQGELDISPEVQAYFQASLQSLGHLPAPKRFFRTNSPATSPLDLDPEHVIQFLEQLDPATQPIKNLWDDM
jgi:hypothetical protein